MSFLAILEVLNFDFSKSEQLSSPKFTKNSKFRTSEIVKNNILGPFYLIHQNLISREIGLAVKLSNFKKVKP